MNNELRIEVLEFLEHLMEQENLSYYGVDWTNTLIKTFMELQSEQEESL